MATIPAPGTHPKPRVIVSPEALSGTRIALILGITVLLALAIYYFVGIDEGMTSVFGKTMVIHEWVHDSRHFLGFPATDAAAGNRPWKYASSAGARWQA